MIKCDVMYENDPSSFLDNIIKATHSICNYTLFVSKKNIENLHEKFSNYSNVKIARIGSYEFNRDHFCLTDNMSQRKLEQLDGFDISKAKFITFNHASDTNGIKMNCFHLFFTKRQLDFAVKIHKGYYLSDMDDYLAYFPSLNSYAYVVGFYHWGSIFPYLGKSKEECRKIFEEKYDFHFKNDYPIVSYHRSEFLREYKVAKYLDNLSKYPVNIIIKNYLGFPGYKEADNVFNCDVLSEPLVRFVSDYNLAPIRSGTLASTFALGMNVIPVYTSICAKWHGKIIKNVYSDRFHSAILDLDSDKFIDYDFIPPINISSTEEIYNKISNQTYWNTYKKRSKEIIQNFYGPIFLEESIDRLKLYFKFIATKQNDV